MLDPWEHQHLRSRAHDGSAHVCVLCGQPIIDGRGAPTTDGFHVHIRCADAQAIQAFKKRQCYALIHAGGWGLVIGGWAAGGSHWMLAAAGGGLRSDFVGKDEGGGRKDEGARPRDED